MLFCFYLVDLRFLPVCEGFLILQRAAGICLRRAGLGAPALSWQPDTGEERRDLPVRSRFHAETMIQRGCTQRFSLAAVHAKAFPWWINLPVWTVPKYYTSKCIYNNINITATVKHKKGESRQGERDLFELNEEQPFFFPSSVFGQ